MHHAPLCPEAKIVLHAAQKRFVLARGGIHGIAHWGRVRANGLKLAALTGARRDVVEAFAFLHDCCREDDADDPDHGDRAAEFAERLVSKSVLKLDAKGMESLLMACRWHSLGGVLDDVTVCVCWDADRLDLGRVGIRPDPQRLCTEAAKEPGLLEWAYRRGSAARTLMA